jgi:hypothetical protein
MGMDALERAKRDGEIMRGIRQGIEPRKVAMRHKLTLARIHQIIEREKRRRRRRR